MFRHHTCRVPLHRLPPLLLMLAVLPILAPPAAAQDVSSAPAGSPFAGYELVEVSYLLRAPDGSLVRLTRHAPDAPATDSAQLGGGAASPWRAEPRVQPVLGSAGWSGGWLFRAPRAFAELNEYVRESWAVILRLLDYVGVVVLFAGSYALWILVRPALLGLSDRFAFALVFAAVAGLWMYATHLYMSVLYALGLMVLPAVVLGALGWAVRRLWARWVGPRGAGPVPAS